MQKPTCKIAHALHEQKNIRCVLVCALGIDDILIASRQYKDSFWAYVINL